VEAEQLQDFEGQLLVDLQVVAHEHEVSRRGGPSAHTALVCATMARQLRACCRIGCNTVTRIRLHSALQAQAHF
jgi:hypothetical protein